MQYQASHSAAKSPGPSRLGSAADLSLRTKLIISFLIVALIPLGLLAYLDNQATREALTTAAQQTLFAAASQTVTSIDNFVGLNLEAVAQEAQLPFLWEYLSLPADERPGSPEEAQALALLVSLKNKETRNFSLTANYSFLDSYSLLDENGIVILDTFPSNIGQDFSDREFFRRTIGGIQPYASPIEFSQTTTQAGLYFSAPVRTHRIGTVGVLVARHNAIVLQQLVVQNNDLGGLASFPVLFDENGLYLAHGRAPEALFKTVARLPDEQVAALQAVHRLPPRSADALSLNFPLLAQNLAEVHSQPHFVTHDISTGDKSNQVAVANVKTQSWLVAFYQPEEVFLVSIAAQTRRTLLLAAVISGAVVLVALAVAQLLSRPISRLTAVAEKVTTGDLTARAAVESADEIGTLAGAFNTMTDELAKLVGSLEQRVEERTAELANRVDQLNLINQVGRDVNSLLELKTLLNAVTTLIQNTFDYYAVAIFLADWEANELYLCAADTSEEIDLLAANPRFQIDRQSIVGHVTATADSYVVNDVTNDPTYHYDDRLPRTQAELVLPLRIGDKVLGVLDLQSDVSNVFTPEDVQVFQTLADQIAVAIHNAELFQTAQIARADAEEANHLKSQFLANMSHELRTPLNSIINFAYLLTMGVEGAISPGQEDMLKRIGDSGRHLLDLINDILDLAKIESGRLELMFTEVDLQELINGVMSTAVGLLRGRPIELNKELPDNLPLVRADRTRVRQVLLNFLSNSAKFTEKGHITVSAWADDEWVTVSIQDTGIGMRAEDIPKAFAEFVQVDGHSARRATGTGLGLPISKRFVELHGGCVWVESELGVGTTFYFTLPSLPSPPLQPETEQRPSEIQVLVIDDDPAAREAIAKQLTHGYRVTRLNDSRRAVDTVREQRPDVVVLDLMMPHYDGWEVLEALKEDPETQDIPVVICSIMREEQLAQSLGAGGYLVKPIVPAELQRMIKQFAPPGGKVLAVDDDSNALEIVTHMLDGMTYQVATASDGLGGLDAIQQQMPDVVILDLMMPGLSGLEVLAELRCNPRTAHLPVIVVTAKDLTPEEQERLESDAAILLQKGQFTPNEFANTIRRAIRHRNEGRLDNRLKENKS